MIDVYAKIGLINGIVALFLGAQVFFRNRHAIANRAFALLSFFIAFWSFGYWLWLSETNPAYAMLWIRLFTLGSILIPIFYLYWIISLLGLNKKLKSVVIGLVAVSASFIVFTFFSELVIKGYEHRLIFPFWPIPGPFYLYYILVLYVGLVSGGLAILFSNFRKADPAGRAQISYIFWGSFIGFAGGASNFFLWYNILVPPYFNFLVSAGLILFYYAASQNNLFNVKVIATEFFSYLVGIGMAVRLVFAASLRDYVVDGIVLALVVASGALLTKSVRREVEQREELERLTVALKSANAQLADLSKFKTQLLSLASHQLKSPLAAIKGFTELLYEGIYGPVSDKVKDTLTKIKRSTDDLLSLINTLLDLRRVEEGKMEYQFSIVNLVAIVQNTVDELTPLAQSKALSLEFSPPAHEIPINADSQKFKQVIQNFVDNAIKYTPSGHVRVSIAEEGGSATVTVEDSGLGMSQDLIPHLFEEFVRDDRVKHEILGTGFGLYIAKKIVEAHGGTVWAESEGQDRGSKFHVQVRIAAKSTATLPVPQPPVK